MSLPVKLDLLREGTTRYRVLWVDPLAVHVALIAVEGAIGWPKLRLLEHIEADLTAGTLTFEPFEAPLIPRAEHDIAELHRQRRDEAWAIIQPLVESEPDIYVKAKRCALIAPIIEAKIVSRPTLADYLRRYWLRGMAKNALLPDFDRCGAPGQMREARNARRGRPVAPNHPPGLNVTGDHRRAFLLAAHLDYARNRKLNLKNAYRYCLRKFFMDRIPDKDGKIKYVPKLDYRDTGFPSWDQFYYWVRRDACLEAIERKRATPRVYDMRHRQVIGSATTGVQGPGFRFEVDATIADIYLRSRRDRNDLIGRPIIYVVIDVFSRMIAGIYVGLGSISWQSAMMALANAVEPKPAFCKRFDIDIEEHEWRSEVLPSILYGDRGEWVSQGILPLLETFAITGEIAAPYRGDWKGIVERRFGILQDGFKPYTPGSVEPGARKRGERDYRIDAVLDIDEFTKIVLHLVRFYNNSHELKDYPRLPGMTEDRVRSIPAELWDWGVARYGGRQKSYKPEHVRSVLLPRDQASVTERGIQFKGCLYGGKIFETEGWFSKARDKRSRITVSYDKRDLDTILVHMPKPSNAIQRAASNKRYGGKSPDFVIATMLETSSEFMGSTEAEIDLLQATRRRMLAERRQDEHLKHAALVGEIEAVVQHAKDDRPKRSANAAAQIRGIKPNRKAERARRDREEAAQFNPPSSSAPDNVVAFPPRPAKPLADDPFDLPPPAYGAEGDD